MRTLVKGLAEALRHLGGNGAIRNAHTEVDRAARTVAELDARLRRMSTTTSRQAA